MNAPEFEFIFVSSTNTSVGHDIFLVQIIWPKSYFSAIIVLLELLINN